MLTNNQPLSFYFVPLFDKEVGFKVLSLRKGKTSKQDGLRLYAIKIDDDLLIIQNGIINKNEYQNKKNIINNIYDEADNNIGYISDYQEVFVGIAILSDIEKEYLRL